MMADLIETEVLAAGMRYDGWADVEVRTVAYDDKGKPQMQVDATNPHTGERVHIANSSVYHTYYGAPKAAQWTCPRCGKHETGEECSYCLTLI